MRLDVGDSICELNEMIRKAEVDSKLAITADKMVLERVIVSAYVSS